MLVDSTQRMTLPLSAVSNVSGQSQVWLIENGALLRRIISTGRRDQREGRIEVLRGLNESDQVLAARFDNLREGAKALVLTKAKS